MDPRSDIARIELQEFRLRLAHFGPDSAWTLGSRLREIGLAKGVALAIEIRFGGNTLFQLAMGGTTPANADWVRRKRNTVELMHRSSYAVGLSLQQENRTLDSLMSLAGRDHAVHGGGFPLLVDGMGCVGAVTVSGAPQREDHEIVVLALAEHCGVPPHEIALDCLTGVAR